jgi:hypothetical protein
LIVAITYSYQLCASLALRLVSTNQLNEYNQVTKKALHLSPISYKPHASRRACQVEC